MSKSDGKLGSTVGNVVAMPRSANNIERDKVRGSLARLPAAMHSLREKSQQLLQPLLSSVFDQADDALFQLADTAASNQDQNLYFESMREVRISRRDICKAFAGLQDKAFSELLEPSSDADEAGLSADSLSLVPREELEELVAVDAMVAKACEHCALALEHLSLRIDNQLSIKVDAANNPFAPRVFCDAFTQPVKALNIDIKAKLIIFKLFDKLVMTQLADVYRQFNEILVAQNILPTLAQDLKSANQGPASSAPTGGSAAESAAPVNPETTAAEGELLNNLHNLMVARRSGNEHTLGAPASPAALQMVLSQLQQSQQSYQPSIVDGHIAPQNLHGLAESALLSQQQGYISAGESDVINLVDMLFEFILEDRNLAAPMKVLLARLQIPLLRLALNDKSFFARSGHPARRLVNEMSSAALGWQEVQAGTSESKRHDRLFEKVESTVEQLLNDDGSDAELISTLLVDFVAFVEKERHRAKILEQRLLDAEDGKARSEVARALVDASLKELKGAAELPQVGEDLIGQAWSNVLLMVALKHGEDSDEWRANIELAGDLIWSLSAPLTRENRYKLLKLAPRLLKGLRAGLESIAYSPYDMTQHFKALEAAHIQRLKASTASAATDGVAPQSAPQSSAAKDTAATDSAPKSSTEKPRLALSEETLSAAEPVVNKAETNKAEKAIDQDTASPAVSTAEHDAEINAVAIDDTWLTQVDGLTQGGWFEMEGADAQPFRCRLAAIIRAVDKYIFVNRSGMKVAEKSRVELAQALQKNELRLLDDGMLFERALEGVIGNLRQTRGQVQ